MSDIQSYAVEVTEILICKFGSLVSGIPVIADKKNFLNLLPQVQELNIYESIFSPVMKCELAVFDYIGLFVNFPLSGEEIIVIRYRNVRDKQDRELFFITDNVSSINFSDQARDTAFIIKGTAIESWSNARQSIQKGYFNQTIPDIVKKIYEEDITAPINKFFPRYTAPTFTVENNDPLPGTLAIPNLNPFAAISMLAQMCVPSTYEQNHTYLFFQTPSGYNFRSMQGLTSAVNKRRFARNNNYIYKSNELENKDSMLNNEGRVISNLSFNKRHSALQKLTTGYFHNNLFEINLAQKSVWGEPTRNDEQDPAKTIYENKLNTDVFIQQAYIEGNEEQSNRTKYVLTNQKENDHAFPVSRYRDKWGRDLIATVAMGQIDLTITIPGTSIFQAGDIFYLEVPEMHGFNEIKEDDLVSGYFLISEVKHMIHIGGYHTTVLRINKDSYFTSIDRESRYNE